jgi:voltage-gated potassium channel
MPMPQVDLTQLHPELFRRVLVRALARSLGSAAVILAIYFLAPIDNAHHASAVAMLAGGIVVLAASIALQVRAILRSEFPTIRALEAAIVTLTVFIVAFATVYLAMSTAQPRSFTEPLNHVAALYLAVTMLSTVGFGDITAHTDSARVLVTVQMVLDIVLVATLAKLLLGVARISVSRREPASDNEELRSST